MRTPSVGQSTLYRRLSNSMFTRNKFWIVSLGEIRQVWFSSRIVRSRSIIGNFVLTLYWRKTFIRLSFSSRTVTLVFRDKGFRHLLMCPFLGCDLTCTVEDPFQFLVCTSFWRFRVFRGSSIVSSNLDARCPLFFSTSFGILCFGPFLRILICRR